MPAPITPADILATIPSTTMDKCEAFVKGLITSWTKLYQLLAWMFDATGTPTDEFVASLGLVKPGDYIFSASPLDEVGRLYCDGRAVSRTAYPALYLKLGTIYGIGDGVTTFNLPNCAGRFPVGVSPSYTLGNTGGEETHVLTAAELPAHTHSDGIHTYLLKPPYVGSITGSDVVNSGTEQAVGDGDGAAIQSVGTNTAHENRPPYLSAYVYVKT